MGPPTEARASLAATLLAGVAAYALGYLSVSLFQPPLPIYQPVHHAWVFARAASGPVMAYYGQLLYAAIAGFVAAALARLATRSGASPRLVRGLFAVAVGASVVAAAFYLARAM